MDKKIRALAGLSELQDRMVEERAAGGVNPATARLYLAVAGLIRTERYQEALLQIAVGHAPGEAHTSALERLRNFEGPINFQRMRKRLKTARS